MPNYLPGRLLTAALTSPADFDTDPGPPHSPPGISPHFLTRSAEVEGTFNNELL